MAKPAYSKLDVECDFLKHYPKKGFLAKRIPVLSLSECSRLVESFYYIDKKPNDSHINWWYVNSEQKVEKRKLEEIEDMIKSYQVEYKHLMAKLPSDEYREDVKRMLKKVVNRGENLKVVCTPRLSALIHLKDGLKLYDPSLVFEAAYRQTLHFEKGKDGLWELKGAVIGEDGCPRFNQNQICCGDKYRIETDAERFWSCFTVKNTIIFLVILVLFIVLMPYIAIFAGAIHFLLLVSIIALVGLLFRGFKL